MDMELLKLCIKVKKYWIKKSRSEVSIKVYNNFSY